LEPTLSSSPGQNDPVQFTPEEHDVRLERGDWIFYVRGVKKGERFIGGGLAGLEGLAFALTVGLLWAAKQERRSQWKVGVVRFRKDWRGRVRLVHKETLPVGEAPQERIADLVAEVKSGRFNHA
jgi:hypothetical protein